MSSGFRSSGDPYGLAGGNTISRPYYRSGGAGGSATAFGLGKRTLTEMEQQEQQQLLLQQAVLRSVKQKSNNYPFPHRASPISPLSPMDSSSNSSVSPQQNLVYLFPKSQRPQGDDLALIRNRLHELERCLLDDDDENDVVEASICSSGITSASEWSEAIQGLMSQSSQSKPPPSPPTTCSSSASSSSSSCFTSSARQLLLDSATAISDGNTEVAVSAISNLLLYANNRSSDPDQRLSSYLAAALLSRTKVSPVNTSPLAAELCSEEHSMANHMLYEASPCFRLGFHAANLAILEAVKGRSKIHIIDFDIGHGRQYVALLNALVQRSKAALSPPPMVKITAVSYPGNPFTTNSAANSAGLNLVANQFAKVAERLGVSVRFNVVCRVATDLTRSALGCETDEAVVVNFAFVLSKLADESVTPANPRDELLRRVKSLAPEIVTLVEQEVNGNTAPFLTRFKECSAHYGPVFESLDPTMGRDATIDRLRIEECIGRKVRNALAEEGRERVERCEMFGKWRARMGMAGFRPSYFGRGVVEEVKRRVSAGSNRVGDPGFTVKEEGGGVCFGLSGRVITVASAWH